MASHMHEGSRKRLKVSRTEETPTRTNMTTTMASSSKSARDVAAKNTTSLVLPNQHEKALAALHTDLDAMRQLITCKICDRFLYEPYALSCGHTYCYSCLSQWLVSNRKKTCPDCRAVTTQQPTPSYIIRELVLIFISRSELLPDGETSEEHHNFAKDEAKIVADDKANTHPTNGGLFKGCFSRAQARLLPIHDPGDGVDRCPSCHWELEDGLCPSCGFDLEDGDSLGRVAAEDLWGTDDDSDVAAVFGIDGQDDFLGEDDFEGDNSTLAGGDDNEVQITRQRNLHPIDLRSTSDEEDSEEDSSEAERNYYDRDLQGFVVNDDEVDGESSNDGEDTDVPQMIRSRRLERRRAPVVISDDEDDNVASTAPDQSSVVPDSDSDEDGRPLTWEGLRRNRSYVPVRPAYFDSEDDEPRVHFSEDEGDDEGDDESSIVRAAGFSPIDESADDGVSERSGHDSDAPSSTAPMYFDDGTNEESDGSDGEDEWGDQTPRAERQYPDTTTYRAQSYVAHNNRYVEPQQNYHRPDSLRNQPSESNRRAYEDYSAPRPAHGRGVHPNVRYRQPVHPFQLGNTLAGINNYNQRNQQMRSNANPRAASESSSRNGGGVGVRSSGTSGSSATIRPEHGRKRPRALSISSDLSYELAYEG